MRINIERVISSTDQELTEKQSLVLRYLLETEINLEQHNILLAVQETVIKLVELGFLKVDPEKVVAYYKNETTS